MVIYLLYVKLSETEHINRLLDRRHLFPLNKAEKSHIPSILAAIGGVIEQHMIRIGFIAGEGTHLKSDPKAEAIAVGERPRGPACPACGQFGMRMVEGCMTCGDCGHSKCG